MTGGVSCLSYLRGGHIYRGTQTLSHHPQPRKKQNPPPRAWAWCMNHGEGEAAPGPWCPPAEGSVWRRAITGALHLIKEAFAAPCPSRPGPLLQEEAHSPVRGLLCLLADTPGSTAPAAMFGPQACCAPAAQLQELGGVLAGAVPSCHSCADPAAGGRGGLPQSRASGPGVLACPALLSGGPRAVCCPGS